MVYIYQWFLPRLPSSPRYHPRSTPLQVKLFLRALLADFQTTMRASVVAVSSVNASFNAISRNTYVDRREPELYPSSTTTTLNTRPVKGPPRTGKPQSYEELARSTHPKIIGQESLAEQVPFPRSFTNVTSDAADVAPQEGIFARCFIFLKRAGAKLMMPPYTVDGGLNHAAIKQDSINLDATLTKLPLM